MKVAIQETERRRAKQLAYNQETPALPPKPSGKKSAILCTILAEVARKVRQIGLSAADGLSLPELEKAIKRLKKQMLEHAGESEQFEQAAKARDELLRLEKRFIGA